MTQRYAQWDGGKGSEDRSTVSKRQDCPLWKQIKLASGERLTPDEASECIKEAAIIMSALIAAMPNNPDEETSNAIKAADIWWSKYIKNKS